MNRLVFSTILAIPPLAALAQTATAPDLLGTWVGVSNSAVISGGNHHPGGTENSVRFRHVEFKLVIDKQEGRNFAGKSSSSEYTEPFVGAMRADVKSGVMADTDGTYTFTLVGNGRMELCYAQPRTNGASIVAACLEYEKK